MTPMKNLFSLCKNKSVLELSLENHLFSDEFFKQANPAIYHAVSGKSEEKVTMIICCSQIIVNPQTLRIGQYFQMMPHDFCSTLINIPINTM